MKSYIFKRTLRRPQAALAVLLFACVLSAALCGLQAASDAELRGYEEARRTIPVTLTVTNLSGSKSEGLAIPYWMIDVFTGGYRGAGGLSEYVTDIRAKSSCKLYGQYEGCQMVGLTSLSLAEELSSSRGGSVTWYPGYDESILLSQENCCLVPAGLDLPVSERTGQREVALHFELWDNLGGRLLAERDDTFLVVGETVSQSSVPQFYCPYGALEWVCYALGAERTASHLSATLKDNDLLDEVREVSREWFAEPNVLGHRTPWDQHGLHFYPYALDIDDSLLVRAEATLRGNLAMNRMASLLVFVLSAGAGFFVGFLMIRQRKREIALMRTLGARNGSVYLGFALEQLLCVVLGAALGGAWFGWQPIERLLIFVGIYFVGLSAALLIFLRQNLLTSLKENE